MAAFGILHNDAQPRVEFLQAFPVFRMGKGVDDRIVDGRRLGAHNRYFGHERRDISRVVPCAHHTNDGKRRPGEDPQHDVDDGHFSRTDLRRDRLLVLIIEASQRGDVHLLGLLPELLFVMEYGTDDVEITADDDDNRSAELEETSGQNVALVVGRCRVRIERTPFELKFKLIQI